MKYFLPLAVALLTFAPSALAVGVCTVNEGCVNYGSGYVCSPTKHTCLPPPNMSGCTVNEGCADYGAGYQCDAVKNYCVPPGTALTPAPGSNSSGTGQPQFFAPGSVSAGGQCAPSDTPTDCAPDAFGNQYQCSFTTGTCVSASSNPDNSPATGGTQTSGGNGGTQTSGGNGTGTVAPASGTSGGTTCLTNPLSVGGSGCGGSTSVTIPQFVADILGFVVQIGSVVVILMLVYIGFLFVTAQGEPGKIAEARQALLWTVVGALILLGAQVIASGITATVNSLSSGS